MKITKQLRGSNVRLEIIGESQEETIQWRDFFFNWGAMQIAYGHAGEMDLTATLNQQEERIDVLPDGFHFSFFANKEKVINAFKSSLEANTDWESVSAMGGKRGRRAAHERIELAAVERFDSIPSISDLD